MNNSKNDKSTFPKEGGCFHFIKFEFVLKRRSKRIGMGWVVRRGRGACSDCKPLDLFSMGKRGWLICLCCIYVVLSSLYLSTSLPLGALGGLLILTVALHRSSFN